MGWRALLAGSAALTASIVLAGAGAGVATTSAATAPAVRGARSARLAASASASAVITTGTAKRATGILPVRAAALSLATTGPQTPIREGICMGPPEYRSLEAKLSADIEYALRGRDGDHAVTVYDRVTSVYCALTAARHFDSASVVKAIILAALLRWHQETNRPLSANEKHLATLMITQSNNDAATDLWDELGMTRLQHFLDLAKMNQTELGTDGYWGLTGVTAHDEMLLLELLTKENSVLWNSSRSYELGLMANVIASERWGTPAGAPSDVTVHVKNGWLPDASGWHINSIGAFNGHNKNYMIAVLTDDSPSEQYGIDTIENVARLVHRDINAVPPPVKAQLAAAANVAAAPAKSAPRAQSPAPATSPWAVKPALPGP
jgi:Beta-lactamase enzyme family